MTDEERKELIKKAFEEKLRLQKELENAKKVVAEKDKELEHPQKQVGEDIMPTYTNITKKIFIFTNYRLLVM